ncbi:MAG: hypothetical protein ACI8S6_004606 [Myxococcota bacterium]|jgi:hypothetical protein
MNVLLPLLLACAPPDQIDSGGSDPGTCGPEGGRSFWAVSALEFAVIEGNVSDGFDLDGEQTDAGDSSGCGVGDATAPDGREGIDNAFGRMLPALEGTEFVAAAGLIAASITSGELLLVAEVSGVESWENDDCVSAAFYRGFGAPMLTTSGEVLPDQTLELDPFFPAQYFPEVAIVDGSVEGRPLSADMPMQILDAELSFALRDGGIRLTIREDGTASGVLAGGIEVAYLLKLLAEQGTGIDDALEALIVSLLPVMADLAPDDQGECAQLSVTFLFEAVPVFVYEDQLSD